MIRIECQAVEKFTMPFFFIFVLSCFGNSVSADDAAIKKLEAVIKQQQRQIDAQARALEATQQQVKALQQSIHKALENEQDDTIADEEVDLLLTEALQEVKAVDPSIEEDRMEHYDFHHFKVPGTDSKLTVAGFAKGSVIHDFDAIASPTEFITSLIVVDGQPSGIPDSRTTFSANDSRFLVASATPTKIGRLSTLFSMDFFGDPLSTKPDPRLRQAYGQLDDFLFGGALRIGQSWSTWDDVPGLPETLDFQGPNGSQQTRPVLLRWARNFDDSWTFWAALENPENSIENGTTRTRWPDGILAVNYHWGNSYLKPAVLFRDVGGETSGGRVAYDFGWGVSLSSTIMLPLLNEKDNLRMQLVYGQGIGNYMNDPGVNDAVFNGDDLELLSVFAGFVAYQHWWQKSLRSNAVFGWLNINNREIEPDNAYQNTYYAAGNLIWSPIKTIDLGTEFLWGQRENKNGALGNATRIQFSGKYKF